MNMTTGYHVDPIRWQSHRTRNLLHAGVLLSAMAGVLGVLGWFVAEGPGVILAMFGVLVLLCLSPSLPARHMMRLSGARELSYHAAPELHQTVHSLAARAGLPSAPSVYYVPTRAINAFTSGDRTDSGIAVTDGLIRVLSRRELTGVLAHEISHIRNGDTSLMAQSALIGRMTYWMSVLGQILFLINIPLVFAGMATVNWWAVAVLIAAPSISGLLQLALSRTREFDADLGATELTNDPVGLADALRKLTLLQTGWLRSMLHMRGEQPSELLRTHPATEARIERLMALRATLPMASAGWTSRGDY